jgi:hypothetical protein
MVLTGKADLIPSLTIDEQRKELLAFTDTVGFLPANLIVASGNHTVPGISPGLTIGVMKGSAPENILKKNQTIRIEIFTNVQAMLFGLLAGHVDGIVFLTPNLMKLATDAGVEDKIKVVGKPIIEAKRGIALRKGDTELLTRLNKAIGSAFPNTGRSTCMVRQTGRTGQRQDAPSVATSFSSYWHGFLRLPIVLLTTALCSYRRVQAAGGRASKIKQSSIQ